MRESGILRVCVLGKIVGFGGNDKVWRIFLKALFKEKCIATESITFDSVCNEILRSFSYNFCDYLKYIYLNNTPFFH